MAEEETISWPVELEVSLFHAMRKHKPVGVPKHFQMICIHDKLNSSVNKKISSSQIWKHLGTMYDLSALDESEITPFPNKEQDFCLPNELRDRDSSSTAVETEVAPPKPVKPVSDKAVEKIREEVKDSPSASPASGTPKRDGRKRTRGNIQSPADATTTPSSSKRARRT